MIDVIKSSDHCNACGNKNSAYEISLGKTTNYFTTVRLCVICFYELIEKFKNATKN